MISYPSFFDELQKIGEEQPKDDHWVTKERLKRLAIAVPITGAGLLVGYFGSRAVGDALMKSKGRIGEFFRAHPRAAKLAPPVVTGLAGAAAAAAAMRHKRVRDYVHSGDERSRSQ